MDAKKEEQEALVINNTKCIQQLFHKQKHSFKLIFICQFVKTCVYIHVIHEYSTWVEISYVALSCWFSNCFHRSLSLLFLILNLNHFYELFFKDKSVVGCSFCRHKIVNNFCGFIDRMCLWMRAFLELV